MHYTNPSFSGVVHPLSYSKHDIAHWSQDTSGDRSPLFRAILCISVNYHQGNHNGIAVPGQANDFTLYNVGQRKRLLPAGRDWYCYPIEYGNHVYIMVTRLSNHKWRPEQMKVIKMDRDFNVGDRVTYANPRDYDPATKAEVFFGDTGTIVRKTVTKEIYSDKTFVSKEYLVKWDKGVRATVLGTTLWSADDKAAKVATHLSAMVSGGQG